MTNPKKQLGDYGETLAARYLENKGYIIIDVNWHCASGELDIIARQHDTIVFVEVKTQNARRSDNVLSNITPKKQERLIKSVYEYLDQHGLEDAVWRIDAIAVRLQKGKTAAIDHVEDALGW